MVHSSIFQHHNTCNLINPLDRGPGSPISDRPGWTSARIADLRSARRVDLLPGIADLRSAGGWSTLSSCLVGAGPPCSEAPEARHTLAQRVSVGRMTYRRKAPEVRHASHAYAQNVMSPGRGCGGQDFRVADHPERGQTSQHKRVLSVQMLRPTHFSSLSSVVDDSI